MSGAAKKTTKKKKKRQQVHRHYKPSLGRYVETYKRTGENARKKTKQVRPGPGEDESPSRSTG